MLNKSKKFILNNNLIKTNQIVYLENINSTNLYLKNIFLKEPDSNLKLCIAETQSNGIGTNGREWISPKIKNIYMTYKISIPKIIPLPIISSVAISEAIEEIHPNLKIQLKWPNDIMINNKKIGGVLVELIKNKKDKNFIALIGIGINLNPIKNKKINQPVTDIKTELLSISKKNAWNNDQINTERNKIVSNIIKNIDKYISTDVAEKTNLNMLITKWNSRDFHFNKNIIIETKNANEISAEHLGIMPCGSLKIRNKQIEKKLVNKE